MKYQITLNYAEVNLKVTVKTDSPQKLRLKVYDAANPKRVFTNRYKTVTGEENLFVRMPLSPEVAVVEVVADKALVKKGEKDNFKFIGVEKMPLVFKELLEHKELKALLVLKELKELRVHKV